MPLPTVKLDDREFQDIVDQAKRLIPQYCPEWTDHNVSDPGVAIIELFAWMTDLLLYRVNQVPEKMLVTFLELLGIRLAPATAAQAPVTLYLSAPQPTEVTIPQGTEVATLRTETAPAIVFTTERALTVRPPQLSAALTRSGARQQTRWVNHDLRLLGQPGQRIKVFSALPAPNDMLMLAFSTDLSRHVLALVMQCTNAGGAGINPAAPPIVWEAWQGGVARWTPCTVEFDGTGGLNVSGEIILSLPALQPAVFNGEPGHWIRCRLLAEPSAAQTYRASPEIRSLRVEARGGTVDARHASTVLGELLGYSDGTPGQQFTLQYTPVLDRDPVSDVLEVTSGSEVSRWQEVPEFSRSGPDDLHYTLDSLSGTLTFGPSLPQPDGSMYRFGAVPPHGSVLRFRRYQHGGGVSGNVPRKALAFMKSSVPYVSSVTNHLAAVGGRNAQSLEDAKLRLPEHLQARTRAVTADDYEVLALQVPTVGRVACLTPGAVPGTLADPKPGTVTLVVLPAWAPLDQERDIGSLPLRLTPERLTLSADLRAEVNSALSGRKLLGTTLNIRAPQYIWVAVQTSLRLLPNTHPVRASEIQRAAEQALYRYLNPYTGGPLGVGWPFGRALHRSEIGSLLQQVNGVDFIEDLTLRVLETVGDGTVHTVDSSLAVPPHGLVCSAQHQVGVS